MKKPTELSSGLYPFPLWDCKGRTTFSFYQAFAPFFLKKNLAYLFKKMIYCFCLALTAHLINAMRADHYIGTYVPNGAYVPEIGDGCFDGRVGAE